MNDYGWATQVLPICFLMASTWQFLGTTVGGYKILKANKNEMFWKNKEKWETVQYFFKLGVKATKDGYKDDCFCLHGLGFKANGESLGMETSLFEKIKPIHERYIQKILSTNVSVRNHKLTQKSYNHNRLLLRNKHWGKLRSIYFEEELVDGKLQTKEPYKNYFVTFEPLLKKGNSWRIGKCQWFLVLAAIALGGYSYIAIGRKVETEEAVQKGMEVLKAVDFFQWCSFAGYNLIVIVYYHRLLINNIKSVLKGIISFLSCVWCKSSDDLRLESTFKPTWDTKVQQEDSL